ncbi:amidase [Sphaerotilus hippei]|uniref:Amidase n=1 Tax=Sphaerotilus hippei TaxID=744406 RepID=A0A318HAT7_9BURK|nr:amidase [Sphaerotilus hippei]PXW99372.1 amidase [Sphaerotilus hippei]
MNPVVLPLSLGSAGPEVMVKDTIAIAGTPTRAGSLALQDAAPEARHAEVVQRLLDAGWRITGKTVLHELAFGTTGINHGCGTPLNPAWPDRVPGGSSSGSAAAVAAGLVPVALGTDTGGSVRVPAACCGIFGLKPSFGRVSRDGVLPARSTLDCVGPLATDMAWLIQAMQAITPDFGPLPALDGPLRLGVPRGLAGAAAQQAVDDLLQRSGHTLQAVSLKGFQAAYQAGLSVINAETWAACGALLDTGRVGADVAARLQRARHTDATELAAAEHVRRRFAAEVDQALAHCDVLALPTLSEPAPRLADAADTAAAVGMTALVRPFNLSGHPAISLPLNTADGLPVGLQLVARRGADEYLCAVAQLLSHQLELTAVTGASHADTQPHAR